MMRTAVCSAAAIALMLLTARSVAAQQLVNIWPGVAPGSENWSQVETKLEDTPIGTVILNVVTPTLTVYLPERAKATGTGVIVAPGGAFVALAIDDEGYNVARALTLSSSSSNAAARLLPARGPRGRWDCRPV